MGTAIYDRNKCGYRISLLCFRQDDLAAVPSKNSVVHPGLAGDLPADDVIDNGFRIGRRCENIHPGQFFLQRFRVFITDHAAHQPDDHIRILFLGWFKRTKPAKCTVFRALPYHAGVQYNNIRVFRFFCGFITYRFQC